MSERLNIAINGVGGRMGGALLDVISACDDLHLSAAFDAPGSKDTGRTLLSGIKTRNADEIAEAAYDVLVDFSVAQGSVDALRYCAQSGRRAVVGTTGFTAEQMSQIRDLAGKIAIVLAPNMSLGVNVCFSLLRRAAEMLRGEALEVDIIEAHHKGKRDAPSGTALRMGDEVIAGAGGGLAKREHITGATVCDNISYQVIRAGDLPGEHTVVMTLPGEQVEIRHKALNRSNFARGALAAARWVQTRPPGLYGMDDVLGLSSPSR